MSHNERTFLSPEYNEQLNWYLGRPDLTEQCNDTRFAPIRDPFNDVRPDEVSQEIPYIRLLNDGAGRPVLYVPGFTEGIVAKSGFAATLAAHGHDVTLPDQNRKGILKDALDKRSATYTQAVNIMSVLGAEGILKSNQPVDVVTHSYGSLIFEEMHKIATRRGYGVFDDSEVIMLAPAGMNGKEHVFSLGYRFLRMMQAEAKVHKDFDDERGEMFAAGQGHALANLPCAIREGFELAKRRVGLSYLLRSKIGGLTIMSYANDNLFPDTLAEGRLAPYLSRTDGDPSDAKLQWLIPVSMQEIPTVEQSGKAQIRPGKELRLGTDASHNDEQFNPSRVAGSVSQVLRLAEERRATAA